MLIIGFSGYLGSGKDFFAEKISKLLTKNKINNVVINFADQLKTQAIVNYDYSFEDVFIRKNKESRQFLQGYGTKCREQHGVNIWLDYFITKTQICEMRGVQVVLVSDVRYLNEFMYLKSRNAIMVRVVSEKRNFQKLYEETNGNEQEIEKIKSHDSETDLNSMGDSSFDIIINNDDIISNKFIVKIIETDILSKIL